MSRLVLAIAGLAALLAGCATANQTRKESVKHLLAGRYVYDQPLEVVWPYVQQLLKDNGYVEPKESADEYIIVTDWKAPLGNGQVVGYWSRYLVQGEQLDADRCIIRFLRHDLSADSLPDHVESGYGAFTKHAAAGYGELRRLANGMSWGARDLKMEYLLLSRVKPDIAAAIDTQASHELGL